MTERTTCGPGNILWSPTEKTNRQSERSEFRNPGKHPATRSGEVQVAAKRTWAEGVISRMSEGFSFGSRKTLAAATAEEESYRTRGMDGQLSRTSEETRIEN